MKIIKNSGENNTDSFFVGTVRFTKTLTTTASWITGNSFSVWRREGVYFFLVWCISPEVFSCLIVTFLQSLLSSHWVTRVILPSGHSPHGDGMTWESFPPKKDPIPVWGSPSWQFFCLHLAADSVHSPCWPFYVDDLTDPEEVTVQTKELRSTSNTSDMQCSTAHCNAVCTWWSPLIWVLPGLLFSIVLKCSVYELYVETFWNILFCFWGKNWGKIGVGMSTKAIIVIILCHLTTCTQTCPTFSFGKSFQGNYSTIIVLLFICILYLLS